MESASTWEIRRRHLPTNLSYGQPTYLDATADGVDKGSGIKWLAHYLGLEPGRIAVIGDGHNDLGMFQTAGLSIAMGNAPPAVQAAAHRIASTNGEDGVAWALRELILG